MMSNITIP